MLKQDLVDVYKKIKLVNNFTYSDLVVLTGLTRSQVSLVLKHKGQGVSLEKMEYGLINLGVKIEVTLYEDGDD